MATSESRKKKALRAVRRVGRINRWLERAGISNPNTRTHIAIELGDALDAMETVLREVREMLKTDPGTRRGADRALTHAANIDVQISTELRWHLQGLRRPMGALPGGGPGAPGGWRRRLSCPLTRGCCSRARAWPCSHSHETFLGNVVDTRYSTASSRPLQNPGPLGATS